RSPEKGLPGQWSPSGENLAWKAPYGGRSTPIVLGERLYLQNAGGEGETLQERVLCLNADTGEHLWEYRFNIYQSDVPPHRVGWASPVADPASGDVYAFGVGGTLLALSSDGKLLWERSLAEDLGLITTHGGRTVSPVIEGNLVIVSGLSSGWGNQARGRQRFFAFDKRTGHTIWVSTPGGRPYDTTYSPPIATVINERRLLIVGGSDGAFHALKPQTGEPVWRYELSKRGINSGAVLKETTAFVSHGEENLKSSVMGLLAAIDASATGELGEEEVLWKVPGFLGGYSSPVIDGDRLYQVDNGANLVAFHLATGRKLWTVNLGTLQRASAVLADGKLYVGSVNGRFFILQPGEEDCRILDEDLLGTGEMPEEITASVAVARRRVYLVSREALYAIGKKEVEQPATTPDEGPEASYARPGPATHVQVTPTELTLTPGESVQLQVRLFDEAGRLVGEGQPSWSLEGLQGNIDETGRFTASPAAAAHGGRVVATVESLSGTARVRIVPPLPWKEDFESLGNTIPRHWISATGKFKLGEVDGNPVLVKLSDNPFLRRARVYMGPSDWSDYTVSVDIRATEKRRQMGNAGVLAQRYALVLFGNHQRLELHSWQPETARTVRTPFDWKADTWYRVKLQVENLPSGSARARGKAWLRSEPEPSEWTLERIDPIPNRQGSPGIYADAPSDIYFDNLEVTANR
ncbi:MAG: PQQ-binding-like beta-propeller repeat protein, partial [Acidobacteriota bacterium]